MSTVPLILVVDDDVRNRKLLQMLLEPEGYRTAGASTGEEALALVPEARPDLILLDVILPGISGHDVARRLKLDPATWNIPIIMVTARTDRAARLTGLKAGAEEFLTKPIDRAELWLRVRNLLRLKTLGDLLAQQSASLEQRVQARTADLQVFRSAMDATEDAILLVSRSTLLFVEVNSTACRMLGYSRAELLQLGPVDIAGGTRGHYRNVCDEGMEIGATPKIAEMRLRRHDGSPLHVEVRWHVAATGDDWVVVTVLRDIADRKVAEERLHHLAHYDGLTGLPNRALFYATLTKTLVRAGELGLSVAVLFMDLDRFKNINDTLGHAAGDELLRKFADRLVGCVRVRDTAGRLGGDEFALILMLEDAKFGPVQISGAIRDALRAPFSLSGHDITVSASIGIAVCPVDAPDAESLMKFADTAMYRAKQAGRDTYRFFTAAMNEEVLARLDMEVALRQAVANEEFEVFYQPKVELATNEIIGFEALLRWERPGFGPVAPRDFIPVLEDAGLIVKVGAWVIEVASKQIGAWLRSDIGPMPVAVNVSALQFAEEDLEANILRSIDAHGLPSGLLELELTESTLMVNTGRAIETLQSLRSRGIKISIDDFGTGYSSLAYLRRFEIHKVKIDIAFIRNIATNPDDASLTAAIIKIAHSLRLEVIAEGVETVGQLALLRHYRCDQVQGFLLGKPVPFHVAEAWVRSQRARSIAVVN
jgi:diguanylate cyclase (GGDEF)-like protein/PAS domain S-box-containing protein